MPPNARTALLLLPLALMMAASTPACGARTTLAERLEAEIGAGAQGGGGSGGSGGATVSSSSSVSSTASSSSSSSGMGGGVSNPIVSWSPGSFIQAETSVSSTPNGAVAVAWIDIDSTSASTIGYVISTNDGASFPGVGFLSSPGGMLASDPVIAADAAGNFWLTWVGYFIDAGGSPSDMHIYVSKAAPGATAFGAPIEVSDPNDTALYDKPWITVTNAGTILITYERDEMNGGMDEGFGLIAARSTDGVNWQRSFIVNDTSFSSFRNLAYPCAPKNGNRIWVTYMEFTNFGLDVDLRFSDDQGATWSAQELRVNEANEPVAFDDPNCVAEGNEVWVSYGLTPDRMTEESDKSFAIRLAHSGDGGQSIDSRIDAHDAAAAPFYIHPQIAREESGAINIAYYAGTMDEDDHGTFRHARAEIPAMGFAPSETVELPLTFLQARSDPRWLGDYTGAFWRGGGLYLSYVVNTSGSSQIAFAKLETP